MDQRYKFDALDFYQNDLNWFSFGFIMLGIHANGLGLLTVIHKGSFRWIDDSGVEVSDKTYGHGEVYLMYLVFAARIA